MGKIVFTLDKTLKKLGITANYLAVESGVRPTTIYLMVDCELSRLNVDTLEKILNTLNKIAKEKKYKYNIGLDDIVTFK